MTIKVMLDIETFGTKTKVPLMSIGAVAFDPEKPEKAWDKFYMPISPIGQDAYGLVIDPSTMCWWMDPKRHPPLAEWHNSLKYDLATTLDGFRMWLSDVATQNEVKSSEIEVWGNGAGFDNVILGAAYDAVGLERPWKHWMDRCFRTLKNLAPPTLEPFREGTNHNALADAEHQTRWFFAIVDAMGVKAADLVTPVTTN